MYFAFAGVMTCLLCCSYLSGIDVALLL